MAFNSESYFNLENTSMKRFLKIIVIVFLSAGLMIIIQSCPGPKTLPTVSTAVVTDITTTSAVSGGNVTNNGGDDVTERGVCWGGNCVW
jgi:hypothetical protein